MNHDVNDDELFDFLERGFAEVRYQRPSSSFSTAPTKGRRLAVGAAASAVALAAGVALTRGSDSTAYGWSAAPEPVSDAQRAQVLRACDVEVSVTFANGIKTEAMSANRSGTPNMTVDLVDVRGTTAIATLHGQGFTEVCGLETSKEPWRVLGQLIASEPSGEMSVNAESNVLDGRTVIVGFTPFEATEAHVAVEGLTTASVEVHDGMFVTWLPMELTESTGRVDAVDAAGNLIAQAPIELASGA